ncbi:hypothetical protein N0824_01145 [Microcystis sp. 0824]|nr:hypothetical protein N0824_01145 [Microcystis sp. 0824]
MLIIHIFLEVKNQKGDGNYELGIMNYELGIGEMGEKSCLLTPEY